ncbi:MAG: radical SAM protein, partial [Sphingomonadaceae bacterium]
RAERVLSGVRAMRGGRLNDPRFGTRLKGEGEWARLLGMRLEAARRRFGLARRDWTLRTDLFRRPGDPAQPTLL